METEKRLTHPKSLINQNHLILRNNAKNLRRSVTGILRNQCHRYNYIHLIPSHLRWPHLTPSGDLVRSICQQPKLACLPASRRGGSKSPDNRGRGVRGWRTTCEV